MNKKQWGGNSSECFGFSLPLCLCLPFAVFPLRHISTQPRYILGRAIRPTGDKRPTTRPQVQYSAPSKSCTDLHRLLVTSLQDIAYGEKGRPARGALGSGERLFRMSCGAGSAGREAQLHAVGGHYFERHSGFLNHIV